MSAGATGRVCVNSGSGDASKVTIGLVDFLLCDRPTGFTSFPFPSAR